MAIHPTACLGVDPDTRTDAPTLGYTIGRETRIGPFVSVQRGTNRWTTIGNRCLIMAGAYIAHDCILDDDVTVCANVSLAGHVRVMRGANIGMGAVVHQWVTIGAYAMIGMGAVVVDDVPPGWTVAGSPARIIGPNEVGRERNGIDTSEMDLLRAEWNAARTGKRREAQALAMGWP